MKSKFLFFTVITMLLYGCHVEFDSNVRVETSGKLLDENGLVISNVPVSVSIKSEFNGFFSSLGDNVLGEARSDSEGDFSITSLYDSDSDFYIYVNGENTFTDYLYVTNSSLFAEDSYHFNLGELTLNKLASANINIIRTSAPETTLNWSITYQSPFCHQYFIDGVLDQEMTSCFESYMYNGVLDDENPDYIESFGSFVTGTIEIVYSINDEAPITETFVINQENYDITINY